MPGQICVGWVKPIQISEGDLFLCHAKIYASKQAFDLWVLVIETLFLFLYLRNFETSMWKCYVPVTVCVIVGREEAQH
jgi:hypothetical protein